MPVVTLTASRYRTIIEVALIIIILVLLFRRKGCNAEKDEMQRGTSDSTLYWQNKYGQQVASQKAMAEQFSVVNNQISHIMDSIARVYNTKPGKIQEMLVATSYGISQLKPVPGTHQVDIDTVFPGTGYPPPIRNMRETFHNQYYTARTQIGDSSYLNLEAWDTLTVLWKEVKEGGLFNRKTYLQIDMHLADTSRRITGLTSYRKLVAAKQFAIGPTGKLIWLDGIIRPLAGLSVDRQTGRWNIGLSGGKDFTTGTNIRTNGWWAEARATWQIIKF